MSYATADEEDFVRVGNKLYCRVPDSGRSQKVGAALLATLFVHNQAKTRMMTRSKAEQKCHSSVLVIGRRSAALVDKLPHVPLGLVHPTHVLPHRTYWILILVVLSFSRILLISQALPLVRTGTQVTDFYHKTAIIFVLVQTQRDNAFPENFQMLQKILASLRGKARAAWSKWR